MPFAPAPDTWYRRDRFVLREVVTALQTREWVTAEEIADTLEFTVDDVRVSLDALQDGGYIVGTHVMEVSGLLLASAVTEKGRRQAGSWPAQDYAAQFLRLLDQAISQEPENAPKLRRLREAAVGVGGATLSGMLTALATGQIPH